MTLLDAQDLTAELDTGHGRVRVLDAVSLSASPGEIVDIVGPSGSGKTTLLRVIARLLPGAGGSLLLDGASAETISPQAWRSLVSMVPQRPTLVAGTVADNLLVGFQLKVRAGVAAPDPAELARSLELVGLESVELDREAARLSVGQQARVALLRVLLGKPRVLLLDEAEAALDDESAQLVTTAARTFAEKGGAVLRVRHRASDGLASRRMRLEGGRLSEVAR